MKLFFRFCIFISFLLILYTIYKSEIFWKGENRNVYLIYFAVLTALIIFLSITLKLNHNIQQYVIIFIVSITFGFYFLEGFLHFKIKHQQKEIKNFFFDKRTKYEVYNDFRKLNQEVSISIPPKVNLQKNTIHLGGISRSKTIYCNENGYYSIYQSDRYGFNNPDEEWDSNNIEYLLVGDSFTHGACVNRPDDIASVLRNVSKKNALNLGYGGNGPLLEYATLREYLSPGVKKILWLYYENDIYNMLLERKSKILNRYLDDLSFSQNLKLRQYYINDLLVELTNEGLNKKNKNGTYNEIIEIIKLSHLRGLVMPKINIFVDITFLEFRNILQLANDLSIKNNSTLYFVYLPGHKDLADGKENYAKSQLVKITSELNIPFIDIENDVFKKEANPLKLFPFERHGHYTVEGYKKTALKIYEKTK